MKILELAPSLGPGGAERFTVDLSNELAKQNDVTVLVMRNERKATFYVPQLSSNIRYIQEKGNTSLISKILQILKALYWIKKLKPDIVHTYIVGINYLILPSLLFRNIGFFFTIHNLADQECETKFGFILRRFLFKRNVKAVTISEICEDSFKRIYGFNAYQMIDNGCRKIITTLELPNVEIEIGKLKKTPKTKVFVNVARIMKQKNQHLLIRAFNEFIKQGFDAILLQIGDDTQDINTKKELVSLIENNRIYFLGTRTNVPDYLAVSDFFCLSSSWEGLPISILEAGLSGCYPISTPAGGVVDVIKNREWGILTTDFSEKSYLKALKEAYTYEYSKEELQQRYLSKYTMESCADAYVKMFKRCFSNTNSGGGK